MDSLTHIIEGCIKNEPRHQRLLYEKYYGYALKTAFRYIYRYDKAIDVTNDSFVKLFRSIGKFTCENKANIEPFFMGWLKRIIVNTAIDELRKNNMAPEIGGIPEGVWDIADENRFADQALLHKEVIVQVKRLPPAYRAVFNMYVIDGYNHQEIGMILGISEGTSKSNLSRARVLLQKFFNSIEKTEAWNI